MCSLKFLRWEFWSQKSSGQNQKCQLDRAPQSSAEGIHSLAFPASKATFLKPAVEHPSSVSTLHSSLRPVEKSLSAIFRQINKNTCDYIQIIHIIQIIISSKIHALTTLAKFLFAL